MRLRLFTLLLVPAIALFVLGGVIFADRQAVVQEVADASDLAELSFQLAELDRSLGSEALESTRYLAGEIQFNGLILGSFSETNEQLDLILGAGTERVYGEQVASALRDISSTLEYRTDIRDGLISPLQVIDRYSHLQRILLDALSAEIGSVADLNRSESLLVIAALAEARSAHLNERIQVGLAIEYQTWAPGQHSAALIAIASHDSEIRFANNNRRPDSISIVVSEELEAVRQQVLPECGSPRGLIRALVGDQRRLVVLARATDRGKSGRGGVGVRRNSAVCGEPANCHRCSHCRNIGAGLASHCLCCHEHRRPG